MLTLVASTDKHLGDYFMFQSPLLTSPNPVGIISAIRHDLQTGHVSVPLPGDNPQSVSSSVKVPGDLITVQSGDMTARHQIGRFLVSNGTTTIRDLMFTDSNSPLAVDKYKLWREPQAGNEEGWMADSDKHFLSIHYFRSNQETLMMDIISGQELMNGAWVYVRSLIALGLVLDDQRQVRGAYILESWTDHLAIDLSHVPGTPRSISMATTLEIFSVLKEHGWVNDVGFEFGDRIISTEKSPRGFPLVEIKNGPVKITIRNMNQSTRGLDQGLMDRISQIVGIDTASLGG